MTKYLTRIVALLLAFSLVQDPCLASVGLSSNEIAGSPALPQFPYSAQAPQSYEGHGGLPLQFSRNALFAEQALAPQPAFLPAPDRQSVTGIRHEASNIARPSAGQTSLEINWGSLKPSETTENRSLALTGPELQTLAGDDWNRLRVYALTKAGAELVLQNYPDHLKIRLVTRGDTAVDMKEFSRAGVPRSEVLAAFGRLLDILAHRGFRTLLLDPDAAMGFIRLGYPDNTLYSDLNREFGSAGIRLSDRETIEREAKKQRIEGLKVSRETLWLKRALGLARSIIKEKGFDRVYFESSEGRVTFDPPPLLPAVLLHTIVARAGLEAEIRRYTYRSSFRRWAPIVQHYLVRARNGVWIDPFPESGSNMYRSMFADRNDEPTLIFPDRTFYSDLEEEHDPGLVGVRALGDQSAVLGREIGKDAEGILNQAAYRDQLNALIREAPRIARSIPRPDVRSAAMQSREPVILMRQTRTSQEIDAVSRKYGNNAGQTPDDADFAGDPMLPALSDSLLIAAAYDNVPRNLRGTRVGYIGAREAYEVGDIISFYPEIREFYIINSRASEFARLEDQLQHARPKYERKTGRSWPPIYGYQLNAMELSEDLMGLDVVIQSGVLDPTFLDQAQILQVERQVVRSLKPGGLHLASAAPEAIEWLMNANLGMHPINITKHGRRHMFTMNGKPVDVYAEMKTAAATPAPARGLSGAGGFIKAGVSGALDVLYDGVVPHVLRIAEPDYRKPSGSPRRALFISGDVKDPTPSAHDTHAPQALGAPAVLRSPMRPEPDITSANFWEDQFPGSHIEIGTEGVQQVVRIESAQFYTEETLRSIQKRIGDAGGTITAHSLTEEEYRQNIRFAEYDLPKAKMILTKPVLLALDVVLNSYRHLDEVYREVRADLEIGDLTTARSKMTNAEERIAPIFDGLNAILDQFAGRSEAEKRLVDIIRSDSSQIFGGSIWFLGLWKSSLVPDTISKIKDEMDRRIEFFRRVLYTFSRLREGRRVAPGTTLTIRFPLSPAAPPISGEKAVGARGFVPEAVTEYQARWFMWFEELGFDRFYRGNQNQPMRFETPAVRGLVYRFLYGQADLGSAAQELGNLKGIPLEAAETALISNWVVARFGLWCVEAVDNYLAALLEIEKNPGLKTPVHLAELEARAQFMSKLRDEKDDPWPFRILHTARSFFKTRGGEGLASNEPGKPGDPSLIPHLSPTASSPAGRPLPMDQGNKAIAPESPGAQTPAAESPNQPSRPDAQKPATPSDPRHKTQGGRINIKTLVVAVYAGAVLAGVAALVAWIFHLPMRISTGIGAGLGILSGLSNVDPLWGALTEILRLIFESFQQSWSDLIRCVSEARIGLVTGEGEMLARRYDVATHQAYVKQISEFGIRIITSASIGTVPGLMVFFIGPYLGLKSGWILAGFGALGIASGVVAILSLLIFEMIDSIGSHDIAALRSLNPYRSLWLEAWPSGNTTVWTWLNICGEQIVFDRLLPEPGSYAELQRLVHSLNPWQKQALMRVAREQEYYRRGERNALRAKLRAMRNMKWVIFVPRDNELLEKIAGPAAPAAGTSTPTDKEDVLARRQLGTAS